MDNKLSSIDKIISRYRDEIYNNKKSLKQVEGKFSYDFQEGLFQGWIEALEYAIKELEEHYSLKDKLTIQERKHG
tara:strand:+ start:158 stop:382 length:225 start_codon:yes stop_codon:yes gene_type:complete